jgi:hypothetical protein
LALQLEDKKEKDSRSMILGSIQVSIVHSNYESVISDWNFEGPFPTQQPACPTLLSPNGTIILPESSEGVALRWQDEQKLGLPLGYKVSILHN